MAEHRGRKMEFYKNSTIVLALLGLALLFFPYASAQYNFEYVNVTTRVNVTHSMPVVLEVLVDQNITLNAGGFKTVYCNATIRDWNGWDDIDVVNATLYHISSFSGDSDSGNTHYTNASCDFVQLDVSDPYNASAVCTFEVIHYANSGDWFCNVTAEDFYNFTGSLENDTFIHELYALNVTDVIDYGDLAVMDFSFDIPATITNFGNMNITVDVLGYGETEGDGLGLVCELGDNIGVEHQRFTPSSGVAWDDKTILSHLNQDMGLMIPQATDLSAPSNHTTYWQLFVPPNPQGECTGNLRFTARPDS